MEKNCGNCVFGVKEWHHHGYRLDCRRHAPIVFNGVVGCSSHQIGSGPEYQTRDITGPITAWPKVADQYFCGDWSADAIGKTL